METRYHIQNIRPPSRALTAGYLLTITFVTVLSFGWMQRYHSYAPNQKIKTWMVQNRNNASFAQTIERIKLIANYY